MQKSEKLKFCDGVVKPNPNRPLVPPGVDIIDDGSGVVLDGGVEGGMTRVLLVPKFAGVGDVARNMSRSAPSSLLVRGVRDQEI